MDLIAFDLDVYVDIKLELNIQNFWLSMQDQEIADVIFKEGMSDSRVGELKKIMDDTSQK